MVVITIKKNTRKCYIIYLQNNSFLNQSLNLNLKNYKSTTVNTVISIYHHCEQCSQWIEITGFAEGSRSQISQRVHTGFEITGFTEGSR